MKRALLAAAMSLLAMDAAAQIDGFDFGSYRTRTTFFENLDRVISGMSGTGEGMEDGGRGRSRSVRNKQHILVYIHNGTGTREPQEFNHAAPIRQSYGEWAFVKLQFDADDPFIKAWGIRRAPGLVALDRFGNHFLRPMNLSTNSIKYLTAKHPLAIAQYEGKLKSEFDKAIGFLDKDESKALGGLLNIVANGKMGYKLVEESRQLLEEHSASAFRKADLAESVSASVGIDYLQTLIKMYKKTPWSARAEIRIAKVEHHNGSVQPAIQRLNKIQKYDRSYLGKEKIKVDEALAEVSRAGTEKIDTVLAMDDRTEAKVQLKKIAKDYAGTDAGRRAALAAASR